MTTESVSTRLGQAVAMVVAPSAMMLMLWYLGRRFLCSCGYFAIWTSDTCSSVTSQQLFDPYSFTHVLHGFLFFWLIALGTTLSGQRMRLASQVWTVFLLEAAWELLENTPTIIEKYRSETAALGYEGDTIVNSLGDLSCAMVGFFIARKLGVRRSLIVFALVELVLILWIHDSLLLQILMLVWPVEAIKSWQMCA